MLYLFLNSISTGEVIIILIFILMFFGSKNIPGMARTFGKGLRQIRDATDDIKRDIRQSTDQIQKDIQSNMSNVDVDKDIKKTVDDFKKGMETVAKKPSDFINDNVREFKTDIYTRKPMDKVTVNTIKEDKKEDTQQEEKKVEEDGTQPKSTTE